MEVFRNIPLLLQIFFWYFSAIALLPSVADSFSLGGVILNTRGLFLPWPRREQGALVLDRPLADGFNVCGGLAVQPELLALTLGLTF